MCQAGGTMLLRTKLTIGLGFLFIIIFAIVIYSSYDIQELSKEAESILRDNYDTLVYCKQMLLALDDMRAAVSSRVFIPNKNKMVDYYSHVFESSKQTFESNLNAEKSNITEINERDYVGELSKEYSLYLELCLQINRKGGSASLYFNDFLPAYSNTRYTIVKINDINMQAIERKNLSTKHDAKNMIMYMAITGSICILLAFFYFWYFPFYISNTMSYLSKKMKELLEKIGIEIDTQTKDEAFVLLQSILLLENKLIKRKKAKK
jgi:hypothetical protein